MRQWNFQTDIEERNPFTGNVYFISRMTSDWAERHPLNVDQLIEDIYQKYQQMAADDQTLAVWAKTREELRQQWVKTLSMTRAGGDASIYPNAGGRQEPALMEVWMKAGDYWRRGFRLGDTLPAMVPGCRITRIGGDGRAIERYSLADRPGAAWIALFPKELHLIENGKLKIENEPVAIEVAESETSPAEDADAPVIEPVADQSIEAPAIEPEPIEASALVEENPIDTRDEEIACLQARIAELEAQQSHTDTTDITDLVSAVANTEATPIVVVAPRPTERERNAAARRRRREQREAQQRSYEERLAREAQEAEENARQQERRKIFAAIGAAAVTLTLIYFFGLLGPAVFGLLAGGLLKG